MKATSVLALIACVGCSPTPERVFKSMQSEGCAGNVSAFFGHVNKTALLEWITRNASHKLEADGKSSAMVEAMAPSAFAEEMQSWEDEIKRNKDGDWCRARFMSADNDGGRVVWETPTGKQRTGFFEKSGDTFLMVGLE